MTALTVSLSAYALRLFKPGHFNRPFNQLKLSYINQSVILCNANLTSF